jgi:hypothetical protein
MYARAHNSPTHLPNYSSFPESRTVDHNAKDILYTHELLCLCNLAPASVSKFLLGQGILDGGEGLEHTVGTVPLLNTFPNLVHGQDFQYTIIPYQLSS